MSNVNKHFAICVVGAGPAGLCAAHHLHELDFDNITVFEQTSEIGGIWNYNANANAPNPLYWNLTTNLPHDLMQFPDYDFPNASSIEPFPHHTVVREYITSYSKHFNLGRFIKLKHEITRIAPYNQQWKVTYLNHQTNTAHSAIFDAVVICNGHYNKAFIPAFHGLDEYKGEQIHSQNYRYPAKQKYDNKTILIVGNGLSGKDIGYEIFAECQHSTIYHVMHANQADLDAKFSIKLTKSVIDPERYIYKRNIARFERESVCFDDGERIQPDLVIFCTGYVFDFPFLQNEQFLNDAKVRSSRFECNGECVNGLYEQVLIPTVPTLFFVGLPYANVPFFIGYAQSKWIAKILSDLSMDQQGGWNSQYLPSVPAMNDWMQRSDTGTRDQHVLGMAQFEYVKRISTRMKQPLFSKEKIHRMMKIFASLVVKLNKPRYSSIQSKL